MYLLGMESGVDPRLLTVLVLTVCYCLYALLSGFDSTTEAGNKSNDFSCQYEVSIPLLIALHLAMQ